MPSSNFPNCTNDDKCPELDVKSSKWLYGDGANSTIRDWINAIVKLLDGDARRRQPPLSKSQTAKMLDISRPTLDKHLEVGVIHNICTKDETTGKITRITSAKKFGDFCRYESDDFTQDPLVKEWLDNLLVKKDGNPVKGWKNTFRNLKRMCNTLKIKPAQLIIDKKTYLQILTNLKLGLDNKTIQMDNSIKQKNANSDSAFHDMKMASRDFVQFHGIALPKNIGGVASGKVRKHGQYKDLRLTLDEIDQGDQFVIDTYGLDSDIMRVWGVGIESGARKKALLSMECNWEKYTGKNGVTTYFMKAYETKTESKWRKYIRRPLTQQSLELARARNQKCIVADVKNKQNQVDEIIEQLKSIYTHLNKVHSHEGYYMRKAFHVMRHIAAQYQIKISHGDLSWVCESCGWKSDIELKASYGELPEEILMEKLDSFGAVA